LGSGRYSYVSVLEKVTGQKSGPPDKGDEKASADEEKGAKEEHEELISSEVAPSAVRKR
jgi:hypothetical protein